ncbi:MAG: ABC transporter ATP-binding protein [Rhodobacteraceae bacterium]|nr:ABC transporter ATP-binding protein [Paracoccaceae bacterium]
MEIELKGITKRFGPVVANRDVDLKIKAGQVLGLLGENGAGKSTLMNVLCGLYAPTSGEILVDGVPTVFDGPGDAIRAGIGMVHQHFMLIPVFTVAENVVLGVEPVGRLDRLDLDSARRQLLEISARYGLEVDPDALIETLPVGLQQRVEIIKVLFRAADVLILDEPTAVLTPQEVEEFFAIVRALRDAGKAIVLITHKLHEILEISDRISVIRQGQITGEGDPKTLDPDALAEMMVGHPVDLDLGKAPPEPGEVLLDIRDLNVAYDDGTTAVYDLSLSVRSGEIVGIAGVQGNGQSALVEALWGVRPVSAGTVQYSGRDITQASVRARHKMGIAHIPEDRQRHGLVPNFTVAENIVLDTYYSDYFSRGLKMDWPAVHQAAAEATIAFDIRTPSIHQKAGNLSGGNQQRLIVAREMARDTKLLIASQPTRGLDIGSVDYIHRRILAARDEGDGVLIVSSELDEILSLSDRILVMFKGRIVAEFDAAAQPPDKTRIGLAMAGAAA